MGARRRKGRFSIVVLLAVAGVACAPSDGSSGGDVADAGDTDAGAEASDGGGEDPPCGAPGTIDAKFANAGTLIGETPKAVDARAIDVTGDGAQGLFVAYSPLETEIAGTTTSHSVGVVHVDASGNVDAGFGAGGSAVAAFPNVQRVTGIRRSAITGALYVLASSSETSGSAAYASETIVRFSKSGRIDPTFGGDGHVQLGGVTGSSVPGHATDVIERQDGWIVVVLDTGLALLMPDGKVTSWKLDQSFQEEPPPRAVPFADDSFLIVGGTGAAPENARSVRYTSKLAKDAPYGSSGEVTIALPLSELPWPNAPSPDGSIVLGGAGTIASLDAHGALVQSFGAGGIAAVGNDAVVATLARHDGAVVYLPMPAISGPDIVVKALDAKGAPAATFASLSVAKSITRHDAKSTKVEAPDVHPTSLVAAGQHRAYLFATYASSDGTTAFASIYASRFCLD